MNNEARERWAKIRARGRRSFIFRDCVAGWGLASAALFGVILPAAKGVPLPDGLHMLGSSLLLFPSIGYLYGTTVWRMGEERYLKGGES